MWQKTLNNILKETERGRCFYTSHAMKIINQTKCILFNEMHLSIIVTSYSYVDIKNIKLFEFPNENTYNILFIKLCLNDLGLLLVFSEICVIILIQIRNKNVNIS